MNKRKLFSIDFIAFFIRIGAVLGIIALLTFTILKIIDINNLAYDYKNFAGNDYYIANLADNSNYILRYLALFKIDALASYASYIPRSSSFYTVMLFDELIPLIKYLLLILIAIFIILISSKAINNKIYLKSNAIYFIVISLLIILIPFSKLIFEYLIYLELTDMIKRDATFVINIDWLYFIIAIIFMWLAYFIVPKKNNKPYGMYVLLALSVIIISYGVYQIAFDIKTMIEASNTKYKTFYELHYNKEDIFSYLYLHQFNIYYLNYYKINSAAEMKNLFTFQSLPSIVLNFISLIVVTLLIKAFYNYYKKKPKYYIYFLISGLLIFLVPFIYMITDAIILQVAWDCIKSGTTTTSSLKCLKPILLIKYDYFIMMVLLFIAVLFFKYHYEEEQNKTG